MRPVDADHEHYKWWALSTTSLGMLLATINSGTLIIALPDLGRSLHTSLLQLVWVILAYMIASTVLVLTAGRLSDLFGRKRAYLLGFAIFAATSRRAGRRGAHGPRAGRIPRRHLRMGRPGRHHGARRGRGLPPGLHRDRAPCPSPDARPDDLQQPDVLGGHCRRVHQRTLSLRADVRLRLLLPGRAGRR